MFPASLQSPRVHRIPPENPYWNGLITKYSQAALDAHDETAGPSDVSLFSSRDRFNPNAPHGWPASATLVEYCHTARYPSSGAPPVCPSGRQGQPQSRPINPPGGEPVSPSPPPAQISSAVGIKPCSGPCQGCLDRSANGPGSLISGNPRPPPAPHGQRTAADPFSAFRPAAARPGQAGT